MICKVQVLKDACRAVIQFMFTQVEHHFGNDLKHPDHQDDQLIIVNMMRSTV